MIITRYFRREGGIIYKYARVTYNYSKKAKKRLDFELDKSLGWQLMEGYSVGNENPRLQEIYRREFNDLRDSDS